MIVQVKFEYSNIKLNYQITGSFHFKSYISIAKHSNIACKARKILQNYNSIILSIFLYHCVSKICCHRWHTMASVDAKSNEMTYPRYRRSWLF
jgi:hypothetical protein